MELQLPDSVSARLNAAFARVMAEANGAADQCTWRCEDGWLVVYTTSRIVGGSHEGRFATMLYKPEGKGARTGRATQWVMVYQRAFSTRKAARARAEALYYKHSPKTAARHGRTTQP